MKNLVNALLKPFHAEIHGIGYLKKLQRQSNLPDASEVQAKLCGNKARVIFDIGANRGDVTRNYTQLFPGADIHAFEPTEEFHAAFLQQHSGNPRVRLNKLALSEKEGDALFYLNKSGDTNSLLESIHIGASSDKSCETIGSRTVRTQTLDNYCAEAGIEHIDILKIDTQGAELSILKGGERMFRERRVGLLYTEAYFKPQYKDQPLLYDIGNYLERFGYYLEGIYDPYYNDKLILWCDAIFLPLQEAAS